jgi:signal transduction histidine kinase
MTIEFGAIETGRSFMVRYQYILEGYDKEWSPVTEKSSATFGNIAEGSYTFKLRAMSPEGVWSEPIEYNFKVLPPWWRTAWAYLSYMLIFSAAIYTFIQWRVKNLKQEKINLEEKVSHRTRQLEQKSGELQQSLESLKATQAQLVQSEKMASLGELTAGIAHEIQNPLNFVNNFSEVSKELIAEMKDEIEKIGNTDLKHLASDIENNLDKINHHGKRADAIVKGMLQHSRTSAGQKEPTNINALTDEYLRLAFQGMRAKDKNFNTTLETDFDETLSADKAGIGKVNIIPQDIGRVLLNLYNNAFYAVAEKQKLSNEAYQPTVSVRTKKVNGEVEISVADNGNGIPEKVLDKVFQPFFTTKPTGQGTGLGLSLSYDIIKAHQGKISIRNTPGSGAEFIILLPLH